MDNKYDSYWKATSIDRNNAINETIMILRRQNKIAAHKTAIEIEDIWLNLFKKLEGNK